MYVCYFGGFYWRSSFACLSSASIAAGSGKSTPDSRPHASTAQIPPGRAGTGTGTEECASSFSLVQVEVGAAFL